jgi:hypothetical protein
MAVTITATVGSASANSYVTLAEAATYMEGRLNASSWETDASTDEKNRALVEATRELTNRAWKGYRVDSTQALSWPRQWAVDPDSPTQDYFDTDVVPQRVKDATMELAFQFILAGTTDVASLESSYGVRSETVGPVATEYEPHMKAKGLARYPRVLDLIRPLLANSGVSVPVVRG